MVAVRRGAGAGVKKVEGEVRGVNFTPVSSLEPLVFCWSMTTNCQPLTTAENSRKVTASIIACGPPQSAANQAGALRRRLDAVRTYGALRRVGENIAVGRIAAPMLSMSDGFRDGHDRMLRPTLNCPATNSTRKDTAPPLATTPCFRIKLMA